MHTYSDPVRDPRFHTISTVFIGEAFGSPIGKDDASKAKIFTSDSLPSPIAFDHLNILKDYFRFTKGLKGK